MKHPALTAYEIAYTKIVNNRDDAWWMPMGSGDVVGRARHEQEMRRLGVEFPENIITFFIWLDEIGGTRLARRLTRQFNKMRREREAQPQE